MTNCLRVWTGRIAHESKADKTLCYRILAGEKHTTIQDFGANPTSVPSATLPAPLVALSEEIHADREPHQNLRGRCVWSDADAYADISTDFVRYLVPQAEIEGTEVVGGAFYR